MNDWRELKTLQEVAEAQAAGEEIERLWKHTDSWVGWVGDSWDASVNYRSRPKKKTKTIVLREALFSSKGRSYNTLWCDANYIIGMGNFVKWLDTPEISIEVEE